MGIKPSALSATIKRNLLEGIKENGTSKNAVATQARIPSATFYRNFEDPERFSVAELGSIAESLDLKLTDLVKDAA